MEESFDVKSNSRVCKPQEEHTNGLLQLHIEGIKIQMNLGVEEVLSKIWIHLRPKELRHKPCVLTLLVGYLSWT